MESQTTVRELFHVEGIRFSIPSYQRAYSWEVDKDRKQVRQFLADLKEQNPNKKYFFGHFLFEKDGSSNKHYYVIDGQQRLTTIIIFMSCAIRELQKRDAVSPIVDSYGDRIKFERDIECYIKYDRNYKFATVDYDNQFLIRNIFENKENTHADSASSKRMLAAREFFEKELAEASTEEILAWKKIVDEAVITTFPLDGPDAKMQATQIFAFQNDRGKDLTNLEKLKAYLMHKLYVVSDSSIPEDQIRAVEGIFSDIYRFTENISMNEDTVLNHHLTAFIGKDGTPIERVNSSLSTVPPDDKEEWIFDFVNALKDSYKNVVRIEALSDIDCPIADVMILDQYDSMPLLLKLFHYHAEDESAIQGIAAIVEKILFKLEFTNADYRTNSLPSIARNYQGDLKQLESLLNEKCVTGFQWWWDFNGSCLAYFNGTYHYKNTIKYVLWKYENYLRETSPARARSVSPIEYKNKYQSKNKENTLDHITPQNPEFIEYTQEFKDEWLNNIGNLALMLWGDNSEKRNYNPLDNIHLFDGEYYSNKEIRDTLVELKEREGDAALWGEEQIKNRRDKILGFIRQHWGI